MVTAKKLLVQPGLYEKKFANFSTKSTNYENKNQLIQKTRVPAGFTLTLGSGWVFQTDENSGSGSFGYQKITVNRVGFSGFRVPDRALIIGDTISRRRICSGHG